MSSDRKRASRFLTAIVAALLTIASLVANTHRYEHVGDQSRSCATCVAAFHCAGAATVAVVAPVAVPLVERVEALVYRDVAATPAPVRVGRAPPLLS